MIEEVLDEVFGLGPLEPLLQDPTISDILVTTPKLVYVERAGKLYRTPVRVQGQRPPAADHREDRLARRPARGRILADGGRAAAGRLARQRGDSAGGRGRPAALDPPLRPRSAEGEDLVTH